MAATLTQLDVVNAIASGLAGIGIANVNLRQVEAIAKAGAMIAEELAKPHVPAEANSGIKKWLASDETGLSSRYMARVFSPELVPLEKNGFRGVVAPADPADFCRCVGLLRAVPAYREMLPTLAEGHGPVWAGLVAAWDELEKLLEEELPTGQAPKLADRIREITDAAERA
jgi:hypothetical protein